VAKDPFASPESAAPDSARRLPVSAEGLAASSPARPPTPAIVPPTAAAMLGAMLQSLVASGPTKLDCMVRVQETNVKINKPLL